MVKRMKKIIGVTMSLSMMLSLATIPGWNHSVKAYADEVMTDSVETVGEGNGDDATLEEVLTAYSEETQTYLATTSYTLNQQNAIDAIAELFNTGDTSINLSKYTIKSNEISTIMAAAKDQNPIGWAAHKYTTGYSWSYSSSTQNVTNLYLRNDYTQAEILERYKKIQAKVNEIKASVPKELDKDELVLYLHDYIVYHTAYDMINLNKGTLQADVYSAYGPLVNGEAVCQGYSEAMKLLLKEYGIESKVISSKALNHAWNQVKLNGKWYHVDATWDDPTMSNNTAVTSSEDIYGLCQHKNFLVDDKTIQSTGHTQWDDGFETCTATDYVNTGITKVTSRVYKVDGEWYYLYNTASGNYLTANIYKTSDIYGGNLTSKKIDTQSYANDYCLGYYNGKFYFIDFFNGDIYTISKDGSGYQSMKSQLGYNSFVKELKVSDTGLMTYVYDGSSEEHTYQLEQPKVIEEVKGVLRVNGMTGNIEAEVGSDIFFHMEATGGKGDYQYKVVLNNVTRNTTSVIRDYDSSSSFRAKLNTPGIKEYTLYVKDASGAEVKGNTVRLVGKLTASDLKANLTVNDKAGNVDAVVGTNINFKMSATGGTPGYQYKIVLNNITRGTSATLLNYTSATTYSAKLSTEGIKEYTVYVKDSLGREVKGNTVVLTGKVSDLTGKLLVNGASDRVNAVVGNTIVFKMSAAGGSGNYQYKIVLNNQSTGKSSVIKSYSSASMMQAKLSTSGVKEYVLYVKDSTGKEIKANTVRLTGVTESSSLQCNLTVNNATGTVKAEVGNTIYFKMNASGGDGNYQYKIVLNNLTTGKTAVIKSYSGTASMSAKLATSGVKEYTVYVKDGTGKEVKGNTVRLES